MSRPARLVAAGLRAAAGLLLVAGFVALWRQSGFGSELGRSFVLISQGELLLWAGLFLLLAPGLLLLASALPAAAGDLLQPLWRGRAPRLFGWGLLLVLLAAGAARWGRHTILDDLPMTGDETMVLFGARMVAAGELSVPAIDPQLGFNGRYFYEHDGRVSAMDFPGTIVFRAAALRLGLGAWPFALLAAFAAWALAVALGRLAGRGAALAAGLGLLFSPMAVALSLTEHAHLLSRSLVALAWAIYLWILASSGGQAGHHRRTTRQLEPKGKAEESGDPRGAMGSEVPHSLSSRDSPPTRLRRGGRGWGPWAAIGTLAALALCTRPAEALACFAPIFLHLLWTAVRDKQWGRAAMLLLTAAAGPLLMLAYNFALTGSPLSSPRVAGTLHLVKPSLALFWDRLGTNLGFNALLLAIYFLGPLAVAAAIAALHGGSTAARAAAAAIGLQLLLALAHGDTGIHLAGPIHYSESVVPLLILTVLGLPPLARGLARLGLPPARAALFLVALLAVQATFVVAQLRILEQQAAIQRSLFVATAELPAGPPAVVIADPLWRLWEVRPELAAGGTWVADLPEPDPYFRDPVLYVQAGRADFDLLRETFPERAFYRLTVASGGPPWRLSPLPPSGAALDTMPPTDSGASE